jgi:hypothetical protein
VTVDATANGVGRPEPVLGQDETMVLDRVLAPPTTGPASVVRPAPSAVAPVLPAATTELLTCPECGTAAHVTLNRREATDFCRVCDYPLFWTPSKILRDPSDRGDESLRRLPGTVGRATLAALACPFCSEPNALTAQTCVRCGRPLHPVEAPPPPQVYLPPPPAPVEPEPESKVAWWVWALLAFGAAALITLIVLISTHVIG